MLDLSGARAGAGSQEDGALGEDEGRVFDENRIGEVFQRREHGDARAGLFERQDIGGVFGRHPLEGRIATIIGAQAMHDGARRLAHDDRIEAIDGLSHAFSSFAGIFNRPAATICEQVAKVAANGRLPLTGC